jgi:hypothetical protein
MTVRISVVAALPALRDHLVNALAGLPGVEACAHPVNEMCSADIVVSPVSDCSPAVCSAWSEAGMRVIVLAALPNEREHKAYVRAGAMGYVAMAPDTIGLLERLVTPPQPVALLE